jgi:hypothetical protein
MTIPSYANQTTSLVYPLYTIESPSRHPTCKTQTPVWLSGRSPAFRKSGVGANWPNKFCLRVVKDKGEGSILGHGDYC